MCKIFNFLVMWIEIDIFIRNFTKWIEIGVNIRNLCEYSRSRLKSILLRPTYFIPRAIFLPICL